MRGCSCRGQTRCVKIRSPRKVRPHLRPVAGTDVTGSDKPWHSTVTLRGDTVLLQLWVSVAPSAGSRRHSWALGRLAHRQRRRRHATYPVN